ncbi:acyltransferase 3 [Aspergillus ambiguus]|uniref:acyltransferase family protein n=1 Tax=Aspergillus ambiguus TaxID=176160 RepID=UPI003CCC9289
MEGEPETEICARTTLIPSYSVKHSIEEQKAETAKQTSICSTMERTKWLDGLRGIAAAIVAADHFFMSDIWHPFVSFWTDALQGRHLVQLPPIRILFSAHGMVTLFMVISGYAISIGLLKARNGPDFIRRVSSAIVRRAFRIYLPVLVTAGLAQLLFFFNLYHWSFDKGLLASLPPPWTAPWAHIVWLFGYMADSINIIAFEYRGGLNGQLWTMPLEFRGSNVVYLLITGLSVWRTRSRLYVLPGIAAFYLWYGNWDIFGFIWGLWLAEKATTVSLDTREDFNTEFEMTDYEDEASRPFISSLTRGSCRAKKSLNLRMRKILPRIGVTCIFLVGYYLLCLGNDGHLPPGYQFLSVLQPARWKDKWDIYHWCWKSVGSAMLVYSIAEFPRLQRPFNTRLVQYLGKISFALYLLHETIYQLLRNPLRDFVYRALSGKEYGSSGEALGADPFWFHVTWWTTGAFLGGLVVCAAHYYTIYVDNRCVALAKKVDQWFNS